MGLIKALGKLEDGPERYTIVAHSADQLDWLKPLAARISR